MVFLVGGLFFTIFGGLVVFSDRFLSALNRTFWKESEADKKMFSGRYSYLYARYCRGLTALLLGITLLGCYIAIGR